MCIQAIYTHFKIIAKTDAIMPFLLSCLCCYFYCAMLCIRGTSHRPVSVRLSVSVSVCLSQVGVLLKRLNTGSHKQHHTIIQDSSFLLPRISAKFDRGHPLRGRRMQVGWVKIGNLRQITGYISKTVKDIHITHIRLMALCPGLPR